MLWGGVQPAEESTEVSELSLSSGNISGMESSPSWVSKRKVGLEIEKLLQKYKTDQETLEQPQKYGAVPANLTKLYQKIVRFSNLTINLALLFWNSFSLAGY